MKLILIHTFKSIVLLSSLLTFVSGCGQSEPPQPESSHTQTPPALPQELLVNQIPPGAQPIGKIKTTASEGDEVVMRVVIGGRKKPIVKDRAVMMVVDTSVYNHCLKEGDGCPTKWDYCCASAEDLQRHSATVMITDDSGQPLKIDLENSTDLKPLTTMVVQGKVGPRPDPLALVVSASNIFVEN